MKTLLIAIFLIVSNTIQAQHINAFYMGHSLSDGVIDMVKSLSDNDAEVSMTFKYQTIPGSPLRWNWQGKERNDYTVNLPFYSGFYHPQHGLPAGNFDVFVMTESVPRYNSIIAETYQYSDSLLSFAVRHNPNIQVYLYEVWHCINSGTPNPCSYDVPAATWKQRLINDLPMWEGVVENLNKKHALAKPVCLIPAGQALVQLYGAIETGSVPGLTSYRDLFSDDIHMNDLGRYFVACVHFAMVHKKSPVGLTNQLHDMWGRPYTAPTMAQALRFQQIAWEAVNLYPKTCLNPTLLANEETNALTVYPNPGENFVTLSNADENTRFSIIDTTGKLVVSGKGKTVNISSLAAGTYLIQSSTGTVRLIKK